MRGETLLFSSRTALVASLSGRFMASHHTLLPEAEFPAAEHLAPMGGGYTGGHSYAITPRPPPSICQIILGRSLTEKVSLISH